MGVLRTGTALLGSSRVHMSRRALAELYECDQVNFFIFTLPTCRCDFRTVTEVHSIL